jgi:hypothetical protein
MPEMEPSSGTFIVWDLDAIAHIDHYVWFSSLFAEKYCFCLGDIQFYRISCGPSF